MSEKVITVRNLVKRYGDLKAVDGISFDVMRGEIFAFLGPNGAGKTTTVEVLECLRPFDEGEVKIFDMNLRERTSCREIRRRIGVLPQDFNAIDRLTVKENIQLFADLYERSLDIDELIDLLGLREKAGKLFATLSGGLKRKVGIAAALVNDPEIVFLDEPTTGLDPKSRRDTWNIIRELKHRGKTIFLTTHYMEEAQELADNIAIIVKGRIVAKGSPRELIDKYAEGMTLRIYGSTKRVADMLRISGISVEEEDGKIIARSEDPRLLMEITASIIRKEANVRFEIVSGSLENVFLKLLSAKITEEGELR